MLTTLDHSVKAYFLFHSIILQDMNKKPELRWKMESTLRWNHLQNKYSNDEFTKLAPKALKNVLTQKLIFLYCE